MDKCALSNGLLDFLNESPTAFQAVENIKELLSKNGFSELILNEKWEIKKGGKYYVTKNLSAIIAFVVNTDNITEEGFRIIGSHADSPTFRIKPSPEMSVEKDTYLKLNVECYGGAILSTWFDRPLGIAGRVTLRGENELNPIEKVMDFKKPMCIIPNLAIHMNRNVNEGYNYNKQEDLLPFVGLIGETLEKKDFLLNQISKELKVDKSEVLDFDLYLYEFEKGCFIGLENEFISVGRQDNLSMAYTSIEALLNANGSKGVNVATVFDNEEVGSSTRQGADSNMLTNVLERICLAFGKDREEFFESVYSSFIISADLAHAVHPNKGDKHDPTNRPILGKGPVIKINANRAYTTDAYSSAIYKSICKRAGVGYQEFVNRSDVKGGSTIGPISSTHLDIPSVDIGSPILAMHSIRELGCLEDYFATYKSFKTLYSL